MEVFAMKPKRRTEIVSTTGNSHIPDEILFDILTRIPSVKSLLRFRCVSESFCSIISQSSFTEAHHQKGSSNHLVASFPGRFTRQTLIGNLENEKKAHKNNFQLGFSLFDYLNEPYFLKLLYLVSLNGLICLWNNSNDVAVCNPFTRQHVFLPKVIMTQTVVFNCCFLGLDPTTKKHKVLMAQQFSNSTPHWNIFTLGVDKSWREIHC
ncbi:hypothetical protein P3S68_000436 [Capsicum galapagoense]